MTLNAEVPAERANHPELGVLPCRLPTAGCADRRSAFPCRRVALPGGLGLDTNMLIVRLDRRFSWFTSGIVGHPCREVGHSAPLALPKPRHDLRGGLHLASFDLTVAQGEHLEQS